jgi:ribose transport system permease protein
MEKIKNSDLKRFRFSVSTELTVFIAYVLIFIVFSIISPFFLSIKNITNIFLYSSVIGISAAGMTMVLLSGGLDISVGSIFGLSAITAGLTTNFTGSTTLGILAGLSTGIICGFINGMLITRLKINPLITTLATLSILRGATMLLVNGLAVIISVKSFKTLGRKYLFGSLPISVLITILLFIFIGLLLYYAPYGRKIYSIGGNAEASRLAGINVANMRLSVYSINGLLAGLSGVILASQTGAAIPTGGTGAELDVIGAVILGGVSMQGGKGKVIGAFFGVLILATLQNGLTLMNVSSFWQLVAKGFVLLFAVILDVARGGGYK